MLNYFFSNLKKRNLFLKWHALTVVLFTLIYYVVAKNIETPEDKEIYYTGKLHDKNGVEYNGNGLANCLMLSINTQTGVAYGFTELPKNTTLKTLVHLQIVTSFLLLNI